MHQAPPDSSRLRVLAAARPLAVAPAAAAAQEPALLADRCHGRCLMYGKGHILRRPLEEARSWVRATGLQQFHGGTKGRALNMRSAPQFQVVLTTIHNLRDRCLLRSTPTLPRKLPAWYYLPHLSRLVALLGLLGIPGPAWAQQADLNSVVSRVADAVCGMQIVILGELPSHGEARAFEAKATIVQRLVEQCGFDTLLFEAPIYDFVGFQKGVEQHGAVASQLDRAIGRFWWTRELTAWRRWLFSRATEGRLVLGGLDDQVSVTSDYARATLPGLVAASSGPEGASPCEETVARNLYWRYNSEMPFDDPEKIRLRRCVREAADALAVRERRRGNPEQAMLENLANYVDRQAGAPSSLDRGEAMYRNVLWYFERMPAGSKVIIWTATVHATRNQGPLPRQPLGARLAAQWGRGLAVVGFTAYKGWSSMAGQPSKPLPEAPPGSLEDQVTGEDIPWTFLNGSDLRRIGNAQSRLLGSFTEADWSTYFDGVVVIREEVAPLFDPWK